MENQEKVFFSIRPFITDDAVGIVNCIYQSYGSTYFNFIGYDATALIEQNQLGAMKSYVAVLENQEVIGHVALVFHPFESGIAELAVAVVQPAYRQKRCLSNLVNYILKDIQNKELTAVYVHSISTHTYSQKVALQENLRVTSLLFHFVNPLYFKGIAPGNSERESFFKAVRYLKSRQFEIYAPKKHFKMIRKLMVSQNMDCLYRFEEESSLPHQGAVIDFHVESYFSAYINVQSYGSNVFSAVSGVLQGFLEAHIAVVFLYLSLEDPVTAWCTERFEHMGFVFSGIGPGPQGKPRLILQKLAKPYYPSSIQVVDPLGRQLLNYINSQLKGGGTEE